MTQNIETTNRFSSFAVWCCDWGVFETKFEEARGRGSAEGGEGFRIPFELEEYLHTSECIIVSPAWTDFASRSTCSFDNEGWAWESIMQGVCNIHAVQKHIWHGKSGNITKVAGETSLKTRTDLTFVIFSSDVSKQWSLVIRSNNNRFKERFWICSACL